MRDIELKINFIITLDQLKMFMNFFQATKKAQRKLKNLPNIFKCFIKILSFKIRSYTYHNQTKPHKKSQTSLTSRLNAKQKETSKRLSIKNHNKKVCNNFLSNFIFILFLSFSCGMDDKPSFFSLFHV